jgi:hypothetical protein
LEPNGQRNRDMINLVSDGFGSQQDASKPCRPKKACTGCAGTDPKANLVAIVFRVRSLCVFQVARATTWSSRISENRPS